MSINKFYGTEKNDTITFLEFGEVNLREGTKKVWDFRLHQKAYDWLMLGRYANDIIAYFDMSELLDNSALKEIAEVHKSEIHHKDETTLSLRKLIALEVSGSGKANPSFFELGQTVFGCIEGMEFTRKLLSFAGINTVSQELKKVHWCGLDISEMFNKLSKTLHGDYHVSTADDFSSLPQSYDVFFSKGISLLYAVRSVEQLLEILEKGHCSIFDYSFSLSDEHVTTIGSGKTVKYLSIDQFLKSYRDTERQMYVRKDKSYYNESNNSVFIDCVYASSDFCDEFVAMDTQIRSDLKEKFVSEPDILKILDLDTEGFGWISLDEFIDGIKSRAT